MPPTPPSWTTTCSPRLDLPEQEIRISNKNSADFECFRFDDLNFFYGMSERERLQRRI